MKILNRFLLLFKSDNKENVDIEEQTPTLINNLINFFLFCIVFIEGVICLRSEDIFFAIPLLTLSLIFAFHFVYLSRNSMARGMQNSLFFFSSVTFLYFVVFGSSTGINIIWSALFPPFIISLMGMRRGSIFSLLFMALIAIIILIINNYGFIDLAKQYTLTEKIVFLAFYFLFFIATYAIHYTYTEIILKKERRVLDSQNFNKTQEELISKLSHQIRTPLSNITGIIDILEKTTLTDDQRDYINTIHASSNNLVNVVNNMVAASKTNFSQIPAEEVSFNLYSTINNTIKLFQDDQEKKKFSLSLSADIPTNLIGNSVKVKQIFLNLLNSLLKYNKSELKTIAIEVSRKEILPDKIVLKFRIISNTVVPIPKSELGEDAMHSSEVIHLNRSKYINLLDLGITQKIIEMDGNHIEISPDSVKTVIEFTASFKENNKSQSIENIKPPTKQSESYFKPSVNIADANILLVEDNFSNQQIIILYIKDEVRKIEVAFNGKEALDKFGKVKYDLILMDVQMPIMDGFKATEKIRQIEKSTGTHTPIIAVTANAFPEDKEKCLASGMDDYISKPFQPEDLIHKMKKHLS
ncbi:response regulator [Carboxylicivirga marina]|uniref:response regulator n=1 Tax=Carboxylicivirga marina TaxID=2800988 RepID=UPI002592F631|nr:response regulator [uncultured Carboxylicivirga sp.]